ncbi:MAG: rod shape-determining protein RodA [Nitrospirae bacterium]|nr:rod shape-determining protein RodA [Nitrospirota bacterium]
MLDRRLVSNFDWTFIAAVLALMAAGLTAVYSATYSMDGGRHGLFVRQGYWFIAGFAVMLGAVMFDYRRLARWGYVFYGIAVVLLIAVMAVGRSGMGAQRWLPLGPLSFQPSEVAKLALILMLAKFFSEDGVTNGHTLRQLARPLALVMVPVLLVVKQPDLGTGLMMLFIFCGMVVAAGIRVKSFLTLAVTGLLAAPLAWSVFWGHLKDYQKKRILVFLSPDSDPSGAGYHVIQSKIAIGSGALTGKGYLNGTQSQLSFLPERHTDFIFSVVSEEWGFVGSLLLLLLFLFIILWGIETANKAKDRFGAMVAVGIVSMLVFHVVINVGMTLGIMPVVGVPLPLVSYGGTSAMTTLLALGLLFNVNMRRFHLFY